MRGLIDGCFDGYHYGHVYAIFQASELCDSLTLGTHEDEDIKNNKKTMPLYNYQNRLNMLKYCKYVNKILEEPIPYQTNIKTLNENGCEVFFHGEDIILSDDGEDILKKLKDENRLKLYKRTNGISTTDLIYRLYCYYNKLEFNTNKDNIYLKYLYNEITKKNNECNKIKKEDKCLILENNWDFFDSRHIKMILIYKKLYPDFKIITKIIDDDITITIYNKYERAIVLESISLIDKVIIDAAATSNINNNNNIIIKIKNLPIPKFELNQQIIEKSINKITNYKIDKKKNLENSFYISILDKQFEIIIEILLNMLDNINKKKDIIVFDIDETCLCNLMYVNDYIYDLNYDTTTGYTPLIKSVSLNKLFKIIHDNDINYCFITGRREYLRELTITNLIDVGLNKFKYLYTFSNNKLSKETSKYKEECRLDIVKNKEYNIILNIGDQITDMIGEFTGINYLIFNPFY